MFQTKHVVEFSAANRVVIFTRRIVRFSARCVITISSNGPSEPGDWGGLGLERAPPNNCQAVLLFLYNGVLNGKEKYWAAPPPPYEFRSDGTAMVLHKKNFGDITENQCYMLLRIGQKIDRDKFSSVL